jgi:queuine tRNA-ribosyltransferase
MFEYTVTSTDGKARVGELTTPHGVVKTPMFMPVGTHGAVKGVSGKELGLVGTQITLTNTYHMYLRPRVDAVKKVGGIHVFTQFPGPILTDSGGYQVFSLGARSGSGSVKKSFTKVAEEGITFQSHLDGSRHLFSPEKSVEIQQDLGADIIMAFDQPVYGMASESEAGEAMRRSMRWLERSKVQWELGDMQQQALFGIVQGGIHTGLHCESAENVVAMDLPGNAIGGLSVGEGKPEMWKALESITSFLPSTKPRYFMGLGDPLDLVEATLRGVDMYDCVSPSRLARHGVGWQVEGVPEVVNAFYAGDTKTLFTLPLRFVRINLHNAKYALLTDPLTTNQSRVGETALLPLATLHHYFKEGETVGFRMLTLHNCSLLHIITEHMRFAISEGRLMELALQWGVSQQ